MNDGLKAVIVAAALVGLSACTPTAQEFRAADPNGYDACAAYDRSRTASMKGRPGRPGPYFVIIEAAAEWALKSTTPEIRATVEVNDSGYPVITNLTDMEEACRDAGFELRELDPIVFR